jgi:BirA family biotin operon repressor/biotin-[acetyl-CoA-carboxylase] ligase
MQEQVLRLFKEHQPEFVSGELISKNLGVSRTAIWKHVQALRAMGYDIASQPHAGYRLISVPDRLYPQEIFSGLQTEFIGRRIFYFAQVSSTNKLAQELAGEGAPDGSLVIAEEQTGGKGRLSRGWFSPFGQGIWCSLILYPPVQPVDAPPLTMLAGVAVARAGRRVAGIKAGIKWPNDLLLGDKKFCGILTEMSAEMERINYLIIGTGINVNIDNFPGEIQNMATSLKAYTGRVISRVKLLQVFLQEMEQLYRIWLKEGFSPVLKLWKELSVTLHCPVKVSSGKENVEGWAEDVDEGGNLILRLADGSRKRFVNGEVSLRPR